MLSYSYRRSNRNRGDHRGGGEPVDSDDDGASKEAHKRRRAEGKAAGRRRFAAAVLLLQLLLLAAALDGAALARSRGTAAPPRPRHRHAGATPRATAVLVETGCDPAFAVALIGAVRRLSGPGTAVPLVVLHAAGNRRYVRGVVAASPALREARAAGGLALRMVTEAVWGDPCPRRTSKGVARPGCAKYHPAFWYSRMFTNATFWDSELFAAASHVLTLQSDTLLCRPLLAGGAPFAASFSGGVSGVYPNGTRYALAPDPAPNRTLDRGEHVNGGLSLRNVRWVKDCIAKYGAAPPPRGKARGWVEDELYRRCREEDVPGTAHGMEEAAYAFASDNGHTLCFAAPATGLRTCPVGVHKPWVQGRKRPAEYAELEENCEGLAALQRLSAGEGQGRKNRTFTKMCRATDLEGKVLSTFQCDCEEAE